MTGSLPRVRLAHVGLWTFDFEMMVRFYVELFELVVTDRGKQGDRQYAFLTATAEAHHQLVIVSGRILTTPAAPGGLNQVSFSLPSLAALREFHAKLGPQPVSQVITLTHGNAWSIYFHDPEGNRVEVFVDTPWHMPQPYARQIDLSHTDEQIFRDTEALCRQSPESRPMNEWRRWAHLALGGKTTNSGAEQRE